MGASSGKGKGTKGGGGAKGSGKGGGGVRSPGAAPAATLPAADSAAAATDFDKATSNASLGIGNFGLDRRAEHANALSSKAHQLSQVADNEDDHVSARDAHQEAADAHLAASREAAEARATRAEPDYQASGHHHSRAQEHKAKAQEHNEHCGRQMIHNNLAEVEAQVILNGATWNAVSERGGERLHPEDFAYIEDPDKPSTWKLRIDDAGHVGGAIEGRKGDRVLFH
jgi:hypothetical protein